MRSAGPALALRYDQKARLALFACGLLVVLVIVGLVRWTADVVVDAQRDFNLARAAIALRDATGREPRDDAAPGEQLLPGRSLADVQGAAQAQLSALAERNGVTVASVQVTAGERSGSMTPVRLRTVLSVPERRLPALLADLANSRPLLALDALDAQPEGGTRADPGPDQTLSVRLEALGFARLGPGASR